MEMISLLPKGSSSLVNLRYYWGLSCLCLWVAGYGRKLCFVFASHSGTQLCAAEVPGNSLLGEVCNKRSSRFSPTTFAV